MKNYLGMSNEEMAQTFEEWNKGDLDSYLVEITRDILKKKDEDDESKYVVDIILDKAGQKGTGKWTVVNGLELGSPVTLIGEAVFARVISSQKSDRVEASQILHGPKVEPFKGDRAAFLVDLRDSIYASKIVSYTQGYNLLRQASTEYGWKLNYGGIALMWRGGCIIRSKFLGKIKEGFDNNPSLSNLLLDNFFKEKVQAAQAGWRRTAATALLNGFPVPAITTALCYFDSIRTKDLPANLIQAQRDFFGAHTYERRDAPEGKYFHTDWTGHGGKTTSNQYLA